MTDCPLILCVLTLFKVDSFAKLKFACASGMLSNNILNVSKASITLSFCVAMCAKL